MWFNYKINMGNFTNQMTLSILMVCICVVFTNKGYGQARPKWYVTAGVGGTGLRDFSTTFGDLQYDVTESNASLSYKLDSRPSFLINGGGGLSGTFGESGMLGWDVGLNIRSAGFKLTPELIEQTGELSSFYQDLVPEFGKTKEFRYWALHLPVSLTYLPFEHIGFKVGADLYYQLSSNITSDQIPYGQLGETMGLTTHYIPKYGRPFQAAAHVGVFAPINDRLRVDLDFFSDITPRLKVTPANPGIPDFNFREMGVRLNTRYYLK